MSRWTATRFALTGLLAAAFAAPTNASDPCVAPMPHSVVKTFGFPPLFKVEFEFHETDHVPPPCKKAGIQFEFKFSTDDSDVSSKPAKPQTHCPNAVMPPCCAFDRATTLAVAPMPKAVDAGYRALTKFGTPTGLLMVDPPLNKESYDHKQLVELSVGVFETEDSLFIQSVPPMPPSPAIQRCEGIVRQQAPAVLCQSTDMRVMYPLVGVTAVRRDESGTWWAETHGIPQPKHSTPAVLSWSNNSCWVGGPVVEVRQASAVQAVAPCATKTGELSGTWVREIDSAVVSCTFTSNEMKLCATHRDDGATVCLTAIAEYSVTKEGLVHGVIIGSEVNVKRHDEKEGTVTDKELRGFTRELTDCPFSFRVKSTSLGMMVSNLRFGTLREVADNELTSLCGMYKLSKDGTVPAPKVMKDQSANGGLTLPSGRYLERHYPQYFSPDPDFPLQRELASQEDSDGAARRAGGVAPAPAPPAPPVPKAITPNDRTAVKFTSPTGMKVTCQLPNGGFNDEAQDQAVPKEFNFLPGQVHRLRLSQIMPKHTGKAFYPTLEVLTGNPKTLPFLTRACVPITFTNDDFDHAVSGNLVVKVLYLENRDDQGFQLVGGVEEVSSMRLEPGTDPVAEAQRRGSVLAIIRLSNIDLENRVAPAMTDRLPSRQTRTCGSPPLLGGLTGSSYATPTCPTVGTAPPPLVLPTPQPAKPGNVPAEAFDVLSGVFGEMLNGKPAGPAPCPVQTYTVQPTAYSVPLNAPSVVPPCPLPACPRPGITGTWVREIGPIVYVVKMAPDHVTITATTSAEVPGGKTYTEGIVLTADYHLTRDGTTVVGLITSVDAVIEGTMPAEVELPPNGGEELSRIQKLLVDKPLAFSVRLYGDVLAIGNVRLPELESARGPCYPLAVIGGRYTQLGDKPQPKPKAVKMLVPRDILPTPLTAVPNSSYIPAPPTILPTSGTLPPLPLNVPDYPPVSSPLTLPIPTPGNVPVGLNSTPLLPSEITPTVATSVTLPPPKEVKTVANEIVVLWRNKIEYLPDPTRNGALGAGLTGQLFLFDTNMRAAPAEGKLTIALYDETPRQPGQTGAAPEVWEFTKEALKCLRTTDERFGAGYALYLPWPSYRADVTRVRLAVRFEPVEGAAMYPPESRITFESSPWATAPSPREVQKPRKKGKKIAASPDEKMQRLLRESEDLRQIQNK
ncbi:MAG: hypothetical protein K8U57_33510 [Planctomycetes bacterium]|nr:hypothetical protein [Planctomycetota bacterium]